MDSKNKPTMTKSALILMNAKKYVVCARNVALITGVLIDVLVKPVFISAKIIEHVKISTNVKFIKHTIYVRAFVKIHMVRINAIAHQAIDLLAMVDHVKISMNVQRNVFVPVIMKFAQMSKEAIGAHIKIVHRITLVIPVTKSENITDLRPKIQFMKHILRFSSFYFQVVANAFH